MNRFLLCLILLSPFLVCNPPVEPVDHYVITGLPAGIDGSSVQPDSTGVFGFKLDLAGVPKTSTSNLTVMACNQWGDCSATVPFVLSRPSQPASPANVRFSK